MVLVTGKMMKNRKCKYNRGLILKEANLRGSNFKKYIDSFIRPQSVVKKNF